MVGRDTDSIVEEIEEFITGMRHAPDVDRVLKTLLFTDIVASTEQASRLGDHRWRELLDRHDAMVRSHLDRFRGQEINTTGDGFVACLMVPLGGIRSAQAIVSGATELGIPSPQQESTRASANFGVRTSPGSPCMSRPGWRP